MQNSYSLESLINITENKSKAEVKDIVNVCKRVNNAKRDYLFVNSLQGKHIPQEPKKILGMFQELLSEVQKGIDKEERVLVIGFAETATAIGQYIGQNLENCVYILQTTREHIEGMPKIIEFEEEHSHAVGQWIYSEKELPEYDRILFVEDEITTGNTIINFIQEFSKLNKSTKYSVASILNWQNKNYMGVYRELGIDTYYVVKGELKENIETIDVGQVPYSTKKEIGKITTLQYKLDSKEIQGRKPSARQEQEIEGLSEYLKEHIKGKDICVLGTEEFMYIPIKVGSKLEDDFNVKYHATTRSPITLSNEEGYAIKGGIQLQSIYEGTRATYLYNTVYYDTIILITNTKATESFKNQLNLETKQLIIVELEGEDQ